MDKPPDKADSTNPTRPAKAPYTAPVLLRWGSLRDITQSVGGSGGKEGAPNKTAAKRTH